jgi:dephospho-CoA kinase
LTRVIGLTGGVGSGKSTVSQFLEELGAVILDADKVGHESYLPGMPAWRELQDAFGTEILQPDGAIDRKKLGSIVFGDSEALAKLNGIVHPRILEIMGPKITTLKEQGAAAIVIDAAILIEAGWDSLVDEIWVTHAPEDIVVKRLLARNPGWDAEQVRSRIQAQLSYAERAKHADVLIDSDCDLDELNRKVRDLWTERVALKVS